MKRMVDIVLVLTAMIMLFIPFVIVALMVKFTSTGSVLYWSQRVGKNNILFDMPKFRSMRQDTPELATHLLASPASVLTPIGGFLRTSSLDEIPQLWCILKGDMTLVGPRPALHNQDDLIDLRTEKGVSNLTPGLTGWAQVNGRDELSIPKKVELDAEYLIKKSLTFDIYILWLTFIKVIRRAGVSH